MIKTKAQIRDMMCASGTPFCMSSRSIAWLPELPAKI